jgi:hypothetical protein
MSSWTDRNQGGIHSSFNRAPDVDFPRDLHQAAPRRSATWRHHLQCSNMETSPRQSWGTLPHG